MMSPKLATLGLLKINIFQYNGYDVIILDYENLLSPIKILSRDSNYIVDVAI